MTSTFCAQDVILNSIQCKNPQNTPKLCQSTCDILITSIINYISSNPSICNADLNGQTLLVDLQNSCYTSAETSSNCVVGVSTDLNQCGIIKLIKGFNSIKGQQNYCSSNSSDSCCSNLNIVSGNNSKLTTTGIIAISVSCVFILFFILGCIIYYCFKKRERKKDIDAAGILTSTYPLPVSNELGKPLFSNPQTHQPSLLNQHLNKNNLPYVNIITLQRPDHLQIGSTDSSSNNNNTQKYQVVQDYIPNLSDELDLRIGDVVMLSAMYNDGWGYGKNVTTGQEGSLPLGLLQEM